MWKLALWLTQDKCIVEEHATEETALARLHEQLDAGIRAVAWELDGPNGEHTGQEL